MLRKYNKSFKNNNSNNNNNDNNNIWFGSVAVSPSPLLGTTCIMDVFYDLQLGLK